ncbi:ribbon-helix-helix domain-containing protein [Halostagnicola kamekurae]|uniref:Ribbon-helix-helix protein, copG family n=1 Tax=Halostagnicola kamekurae TaxID=619731 RepID=A0A1I6V978_9EURY|nr:ribbon-helix-helix domain-containing protein [Halostagnicola kamekurae]SFT10165.1 Ribbon-helix-helix protein, copG family [Halostagnicola kamekurae]
MSTDTGGAGDGDGNGTTKIDVRVPTQLLEGIDEEYERRGYTSRSEAIRDALRDWLNPSVELSDDVLEDLHESRKQRERGETHSLEDVMDKYDVDAE